MDIKQRLEKDMTIELDEDMMVCLADWFELNFKRTPAEAAEDARDLLELFESEGFDILDKRMVR